MAGHTLSRRINFAPYLTGEANAAETNYGSAPPVAGLLKQGEASPAPKTPAKRPATLL